MKKNKKPSNEQETSCMLSSTMLPSSRPAAHPPLLFFSTTACEEGEYKNAAPVPLSLGRWQQTKKETQRQHKQGRRINLSACYAMRV